jgi:Protein of unknown function (DUF3501)
MPRPVQRPEILGLAAYEERRPLIQKRVLFEKARRRVHLGGCLTFLFENAETVRYQVQELLRIEKREDEGSVLHELGTYNELLGGPGELGCTLLIEIDDPRERELKLSAWLKLPEHLYVRCSDGSRIRARFDARQVGERRVSAVHYLKFPVGSALPVALGCDLPGFGPDGRGLEVELSADQRNALQEDLR